MNTNHTETRPNRGWLAAILMAMALSVALLAFLSESGCATANTNAFRTIGTIEASVDKAMIVYCDYSVAKRKAAGGAMEELTKTDGKVATAYAAYVKAKTTFYEARAAYAASKAAGTDDMTAALAAASSAAVNLADLITSITGVKTG